MIATLEHGESFIRENGTTVKIGSVKTSTRATYSLSSRAYFYEGTLAQNPSFPEIPPDYSPVGVGEYLTRVIDGKIYIVETLQIQSHSPGQDYVYLAQANDIVTLAHEKPAEAGSNRDPKWEIYAENVKIFKTTTTRSMKEQNDGLLDQTIYICHLPSRYEVRKLDRVYLTKEGLPLADCQFYRVDSIDDSLSPLDDTIDLTGIDVLQLTHDKRTGNPIDPSSPDPGGGDDWGEW